MHPVTWRAVCGRPAVTEYFTSHSYTPVREVARSTETGAATNIIYGLALGGGSHPFTLELNLSNSRTH